MSRFHISQWWELAFEELLWVFLMQFQCVWLCGAEPGSHSFGLRLECLNLASSIWPHLISPSYIMALTSKFWCPAADNLHMHYPMSDLCILLFVYYGHTFYVHWKKTETETVWQTCRLLILQIYNENVVNSSKSLWRDAQK